MCKRKSFELYFIIFSIILTLGIGVAIIGCGDDPVSNDNGDTEPIYDWYVAADGSDTNNGSKDSPFRSIKRAFVAVETSKGVHDSIKVGPGTYSMASGEVFPLRIPDSTTLIGDVDNKGVAEGDSTKVSGYASYGFDDINCTMVGGDGSKITGLFIYQPHSLVKSFCVVSEDDNVTLENCSFSSEYACVRFLGSGDPIVRNCVMFDTPYYGVYTGSTGSALVENNEFNDGAYFDSERGTPQVLNNTFEGNTARACEVQNGNATIDGNSFTGMYGFSALRLHYSGSCTVRNNTFTVSDGACVQILGVCSPDLGTIGDPGNNVFGGASGLAISMQSDEVVSAFGNTWYNDPVDCGTEVLISSGGKVGFGVGATDTCYGIR